MVLEEVALSSPSFSFLSTHLQGKKTQLVFKTTSFPSLE